MYDEKDYKAQDLPREDRKKPSRQKTEISYDAPRAIHIGDVFYIIEKDDIQRLRQQCKVCEGKKKLTVNGITFDCPCCDSEDATIEVCGYVVRCYRVFMITDKLSVDEWESNRHLVRFHLFRKSEWNGYTCREIGESDLTDLNKPIADMEGKNYYDMIYDDYAMACKVAAELTAREVEQLQTYNESHGTTHQAIFYQKNDPQSNEEQG